MSIISFLLLTISLLADNSPFARYPSLNSNGSMISFSFQGDIWTVAAEGGEAKRLTIHEGYEGVSKWSPDNKQIGFSGNRFGNNDIFVIPSEGGIPNRLTFHSAADEISDWGTDGNILFETSRLFKQVERDSEIFKVNAEGGTPERYLDATGSYPVLSPDGRYIAFVRGSARVTRETYNGPANPDIWLYDTKNNSYKQLTDFEGNDFMPQWGDSKTLYFLSALSGRYNIHKLSLNEGENKKSNIEQITEFEDDGIRHFSVSRDGSSIVFERKAEIFLMKTGSKTESKVNINVAADYRFDPYEYKSFSGSVTEYSVSPNGKYTAFVVHGEIFVTENDKEKSKTINISNNPYRDQNVEWLSDTTLIFISDRFGQFDLFVAKSADEKQPSIFKSLKHELLRLTSTDEDETYPVVSNDKKKIAYEVGTGKLIAAEISAEGELSNEIVLLDGWDAPSNVCWSPDDKWLAYSLDDLYFNEEIYIHAADNSKEPVNVTMHPRGDVNPVWSNDGSKLGFLSARNNRDSDVWFVWLTKEDWEKTKQEWEEDDVEEEKSDNDKKKKDDEKESVKPIKIDFENIHERLVQITSLPGDESGLAISDQGETFYFTSDSKTKKGKDLYSIKWDGTEIKEVIEGGQSPYSIKLTDDGKHLHMLKKGKLARLNIKSGKTEDLPFNAGMKMDYPKEYDQIFEEAWRALNTGFYDPDFHGQDWEGLKKKYKPWVMKTSTSQDFREIYNYMLGQLNASHMGLYRTPDRAETQKQTTGLLGVEVKQNSSGVEVTNVITNSPADKQKSKLNVGDIIFSVNGEEIKAGTNFYSLLLDTRNKETLLEVKNSKGEVREVVIRPASSLTSELYDEWVNSCRKLVDKYSNGRLGYLHIRAMGWDSFERFERELTAAGHGKEGIVIDVRFNGGGWTTDFLMTVLNYKQHAYTIPRGAAENLEKENKNFTEYYPLGERLPYAAWTKPSISICNANSYSNAEIFSHAYKTLGIGTLVGVPTFGAVISTGSRTLIDGSYVRLPGRGWYVKATGQNMENIPAVPDIIVDNSPDGRAKGKDEQLERAVNELLKQIDKK
jgi:C-terminal processing protease CtpA/Prc/tricorn protease-like protein